MYPELYHKGGGFAIMNDKLLSRVEAYLQKKFGNYTIKLKQAANDPNMAEVFLKEEFIGTLYKDTEEGEVSFDFNMSILSEDLV
jgi:hypothetical protein